MKNRIISLLFAVSSLLCWGLAAAQDLRADAPDRYTVQRGDTLWGISGRYLTSPWNWPKLWGMNRPQIRNPHLIYPGDVLVLDRSTGRLNIERGSADTVRLSPRIRTEEMKQAVPTIPPSAIEAFVTRPMVVDENELANAPYVMATQESRVVVGAGNVAYVKGLTKEMGDTWQIYRRGDRLVDPETGSTLGFAAQYLGEAVVRQFGEVSRIEITKSAQEILIGDKLVAMAKEAPLFAYVPRAPNSNVRARVMATADNLYETGRYSVVALSRGAKDGVEVGNVLALTRSPTATRYALRTSPIFGRVGITGSDSRRTYYQEQLNVRESPVLFDKRVALNESDLAKIPVERYGLVMVFRTFERASFALVMEANSPVAVDDIAATP